MKQLVLNILCAAAFSTSAFATIVTHESIAEIADHIRSCSHDARDVWVVFDLDNTIMHPRSEVGSDQWFEHLIKERVARGVSAAHAVANVLPLYHAVQRRIDLTLVENATAQLIADFQSLGMNVIGLTARYNPLVDRTLEQLSSLGVVFSDQIREEVLLECHVKPGIYKKGVLFCSSNSKGQALFSFFKKVGVAPKKLFFIDDKKHHVEKVDQAAGEHGVDSLCVHYTACQERVDSFDPAQAEHELRVLCIEGVA